jgi:hypothetical protein
MVSSLTLAKDVKQIKFFSLSMPKTEGIAVASVTQIKFQIIKLPNFIS